MSKSAGEGVDIFIIDKGINTMHLDFVDNEINDIENC